MLNNYNVLGAGDDIKCFGRRPQQETQNESVPRGACSAPRGAYGASRACSFRPFFFHVSDFLLKPNIFFCLRQVLVNLELFFHVFDLFINEKTESTHP